MTEEILLECRDVMKLYPSAVEGLTVAALRGINIVVNKGEMVSIIGPSGAGKTTLLKLLSAFDKPSSGEIRMDNVLVNSLKESELFDYRQKIGIMYQSPKDNLVWGFSVLDNIMLPMRYAGYTGNQKVRALELLEKLGLSGKENRKPNQLSGGEQQRVSIAVALANEPLLLIADEPTGELDSYTTKIIIDYFKQLNQETGLSIIVVTHDNRFSNTTEKTYQMRDGSLVGYHVPAGIDTTRRDELTLVDTQGTIRLPKEVFEKFKGLKSVKVVIKENKIELIPLEHDSVNEVGISINSKKRM